MKLSDDLTQLTARLMLVQERREAINVAQELAGFVEKIDALENTIPYRQQKVITAELKFTLKEISSMPRMSKTFKKEFIANGLVTHIVKRPSGKSGFYYEIQYRRNGYYITASSKNLAEAKKKFLKKTEVGEIEKYKKQTCPILSTMLFQGIADDWFEYKKGKIDERTIYGYRRHYERFLLPAFGDRLISTIKTLDIDKVMSQLSPRAYEDTRIVINSIFKYALKNGLVPTNPVELVEFKKAERENRRCLTPSEVAVLLEALKRPEFTPYKDVFLIMLYFGLRPCEVHTARIENGYLISRNAKRKGGKIEYKKIPISERIQGKINFSIDFSKTASVAVLEKKFNLIFPAEDLTPYCLRHTFATVCQQYVRPDIVDIWMGDSPERLVGRVYTHFSDEFMKEQMDKVLFDI